MRRGCAVFGLAALSFAEWLLRALNLYEPLRVRRWSPYRLIPASLRSATSQLAAALFPYFLAQFLALFTVFLTSAFIQLTLKVRACRVCACVRSEHQGLANPPPCGHLG
jgi:hypothetical protein